MCEDSKCKTVLKYTSHCQSYIENCLKVCYFAAVQDPPMFLDFEPGEDTFDRQVYKEYTQMGTKVNFLVWPALFLLETLYFTNDQYFSRCKMKLFTISGKYLNHVTTMP
jgi:ferredoxin